MASKTLLELTSDTPGATDLLYFVKNPGGSPLDRAVTLANLGTALGTSLTQHQIGFGSASNTVTGDAGFTFDPTFGGIYALKTILDSPASGDARLAQFELTLSAMASVAAVVGAEVKVVTDGGTTANSVTALNVVSYPDDVTTDSVAVDIYTGPASAANAFGIRIDDVTGGMANYAIKTGTGDIVFGSLAGTGSRPVVADANGKLSAL